MILWAFIFLNLSVWASPEGSLFDTGYSGPEVSPLKSGQKVLVHLNTMPSDDQFRMLVLSFSRIKQADPKASIKVVVHGPAVRFFVASRLGSDLAAQVDKARQMGVEFLFCNHSLRREQIHVKDLYQTTVKDIIPAAIPEILRLQDQGYKYLRYF